MYLMNIGQLPRTMGETGSVSFQKMQCAGSTSMTGQGPATNLDHVSDSL